jgi:Flp pilus assembly protein TadD
MKFSCGKVALCIAASTFLWGCTDGDSETARPVTKNDMPVENFFRTAAATSQDKFDYQSAAKYYQNLYNRDPTDIAALLGLVKNLRYIGQAAQSVAVLEQTEPDNLKIFAVRAEYGKSLVASGRALVAIEVLVEMLEEIPDDWELLSALGIAYDLNDDSANAERSYHAALDVTPRNASVINNLALSMALSGRIDEGISLLEETMMSSLSTPHIRQNLALMYAMKGDMNSAQKMAEQDLPQELVDNNLKYYERFFARSSGAQSSGVVQVARLEEPVEAAIEPVIPPAAQDTTAAVTPAAVTPAAVTPAAVKQEADEEQPDLVNFLPLEGIKIQLGVFKTLDRANAGLTEMRDGNVDLLSGLRFVIDEIEGIDAPIGFIVLAGPLASQQLAADLCTKLHSRKKVCRLVLP